MWNIRDLFFTPQIDASIVSLLTDQELINLGINTVGDRAMLRKHCHESVQSEWILILYTASHYSYKGNCVQSIFPIGRTVKTPIEGCTLYVM